MLVEILTLVHLVVAAATVGLGTAWPLLASKVALEDATARLHIDTKRYTFRDTVITQLSIDELNRVKKNVKNELKKYDQQFKVLFYKEPGKPEKEPLRPLSCTTRS